LPPPDLAGLEEGGGAAFLGACKMNERDEY